MLALKSRLALNFFKHSKKVLDLFFENQKKALKSLEFSSRANQTSIGNGLTNLDGNR